MKFFKLASVLTSISVVLASGPTEGEAEADPNSAVVKLTTKTFKEFLETNPLVLAEFYAPWCGYCKKLAPEFVKAADSLNESNPGIKLAQIDCTVEEDLCRDFGIRGYPTLKVFRGTNEPDDYEGAREADGIIEYMIKETKPVVQVPESVEQLLSLVGEQTKPFAIQIFNNIKDTESNSTFHTVANALRRDLTFITANSQEIIESLTSKYFDFNIKDFADKVGYLVINPLDNSVISYLAEEGEKLTSEGLTKFIKTEIVPYFGDINRDTYMTYMESPTPLGYYFYKTQEQRDAVAEFFTKLAKKYRSKLNFVGLDATLFGRHAEILNMDPDIVPLFAIQDSDQNKKYGINQKENPEGPSIEQIEELVEDYISGKASPIVKSEDLPTDEEIESSPVYPLVGHNHAEVLKDTTKDIFVKYYAHWCGHCKKLAPIWDEFGELYKSNNANVVIAKIDHSKNDVETSDPIEGYPTLLLYPANGEIDEKTGLRKPISFRGARELDSLIDFVKESGALKVDGHKFKKAVGEDEDEEEQQEKAAEVNHDEL